MKSAAISTKEWLASAIILLATMVIVAFLVDSASNYLS